MVLGSRLSEAQYTADFQTNLISGVTSNWTGNYLVGDTNFADVLLIQNSGVLSNGYGYLGFAMGSSNNVVLVRGLGSIWNNHDVVLVGYRGSGNSLIINNGARVSSSFGPKFKESIVGSSSQNNQVLVSDTGSIWSNRASLSIGVSGSGNSLIISNGGQVISSFAQVGSIFGFEGNSGGSNNNVHVIGLGSTLILSQGLALGNNSQNNSLEINNDGQVIADGSSNVGSLSNGSSNSVRIASGGIWQNIRLTIGNQGSSNSVVIADGFVSATNILVGAASTVCDNLLQLDGGNVVITNASTNAVLEVRRGKLVLNGGTLQVDRFVMTNACAQFVRTGGTLLYGLAVLDPNRDDDGDGTPNGWEQSSGLDPLNAADGNVDSDGDGFTNLQEYLAGTDPTNSASAFRINSVIRMSNDVLITWITGIGKTNALQRSSGSSGSFSNNFTDIFTVTNTTGTATNYLDVGAATNVPALYYRVRVVP